MIDINLGQQLLLREKEKDVVGERLTGHLKDNKNVEYFFLKLGSRLKVFGDKSVSFYFINIFCIQSMINKNKLKNLYF